MNRRAGVGIIYRIMLNKEYPFIEGSITQDGKFCFYALDEKKYVEQDFRCIQGIYQEQGKDPNNGEKEETKSKSN